MKKLVMFVLALAGLWCIGCQNSDQGASEKSLCDRLGGRPAITLVVNDFVDRAATDPKVNFTRKGIPGAEWDPTPENVAHLKASITDFVVQASGGPQVYKGRSMKEAHANMRITSAEFDAIAADLKASLDKYHVPEKEQNELLSAVAGTKKDIVTAP